MMKKTSVGPELCSNLLRLCKNMHALRCQDVEERINKATLPWRNEADQFRRFFDGNVVAWVNEQGTRGEHSIS